VEKKSRMKQLVKSHSQVHELGGLVQTRQNRGKKRQALVGFDVDLAFDVCFQNHFHPRRLDHFAQGFRLVLMAAGEI
jgi:hypothetical protein